MCTVARVDVAAPRRYSHPDDSTPQLPGRRSAAYDGAGFTAATHVVPDIAPRPTTTTTRPTTVCGVQEQSDTVYLVV